MWFVEKVYSRLRRAGEGPEPGTCPTGLRKSQGGLLQRELEGQYMRSEWEQ